MPADRKPTEDEPKIEGAPALSTTDWDAIGGEEVEASEIFENGDIRYEEDEDDPHGDLEEEDDDNPFQESDEALPDDREERAIGRQLLDDESTDESR